MEAGEDPTAYHHEEYADHDVMAAAAQEDEETHHHHDHMELEEEEQHHHHHQGGGLVAPPQVHLEFLDRQPTKEEIWQMKRATKRPSEWLKLLCKDWAEENLQLVESTDHKFLEYKPYLKGFLTSQLLCRLCIPTASAKKDDGVITSDPPFDFWKMLNIQDDFDKAYIVAQVERFCTLYHIRGGSEVSLPALGLVPGTASGATPEAAAAAAAAAVAAANGHYLSPDATAAAVAAAQLAASNKGTAGSTSPITTAAAAAVAASRIPTAVGADAITKAQRLARDAERALEQERKQSAKREQKRQSQERKLEKQREREELQNKKKLEKAAREQTREEKRKKKLELREQRERFAQEQKEAALKRAAELVASNRVPIEITRGAAAAKEAADKALKELGANVGTTSPTNAPVKLDPDPAQAPSQPQQVAPQAAMPGPKKQRSAIVVSTASDLHQIVTHSKNLWAKYNAIAKEHNQRVNWITVAKELGIHVKVREKYARMHSRAEQRGFDWVVNGHLKIKDHPEIFMHPTEQEKNARMPPPPPDASRTVVIENYKPPELGPAAAAAVVDATVVGTNMGHTSSVPTGSADAGYSAAATAVQEQQQQEHPGGGTQGNDSIMV